MASYQQLLDAVHQLADKYGFDDFLTGYEPDLINILMQNHIENVHAADSYEKCIAMLNQAISAHLGASVNVNNYMSDEQDRHQLYALFKAWTAKLEKDLAPPTVQVASVQSTPVGLAERIL